jgi:hypothetical protein
VFACLLRSAGLDILPPGVESWRREFRGEAFPVNRFRLSEGTRMMTIRALCFALATFGLLASSLAAPAHAASATMKMLDTDKDGTVDLNEANSAASALFDRLDSDKDGTLDAKELRGRIGAKELKAADPDNDGTLSKDEYLAAVANWFKAADPDADGKLDEKELRSPAGRKLLRLLH